MDANMRPKNCTDCGSCCTLAVRLWSDDVERIKKAGHRESQFVEKKGARKFLKSINNYCIFLEIVKGKGKCAVYDARPKQCLDYPGTEECTLRRHITLTRF